MSKLINIGDKAGQMELEADVEAKLPAPSKGKTFLFTTTDNNLSRQDPRLRTLDGAPSK